MNISRVSPRKGRHKTKNLWLEADSWLLVAVTKGKTHVNRKTGTRKPKKRP